MMLLASAVALIPMIISDLRTREVNLLWLLFFGSIQIFFNGISHALLNSCILLIMLSGIYLYLIVRYGVKTSITDYLGTGDILFLLTLTTTFPIKEFTYFLITGFMFSIIFWIISNKNKTIPLVSTLGITYIVWLSIELLK